MNKKGVLLLVLSAAIFLIVIMVATWITRGMSDQQQMIVPFDQPTPTRQPEPPSITAVPTVEIEQSFLTPYDQGPTIYQQTDEYIEKQASIAAQEVDFYERSQAIAELRSDAPHEGEFFFLDYNYEDLTFYLTIPQNRISQGNDEFNQFLQDRRLSRDDITNLVPKYQ